MRNGAINSLSSTTSREPDTGWDVDERPTMRLVWLFVLIALPLVAVVVRLAHLDLDLVDNYVASFATTSESLESIPSLDGRIYGGDGRVLAEDVERDNLRVHYRWLEDPPNPHWLLQQALSKLTRADAATGPASKRKSRPSSPAATRCGSSWPKSPESPPRPWRPDARRSRNESSGSHKSSPTGKTRADPTAKPPPKCPIRNPLVR